MYVWLSVCLYVCMHACMYAYICIYVCVCLQYAINMYIHIYIRVYYMSEQVIEVNKYGPPPGCLRFSERQCPLGSDLGPLGRMTARFIS